MSRVENFGQRVKQLQSYRGIRTKQLAQVALGPEASDEELKAWSKRLNKLKRGAFGHTKPGLDRIYSIAKGFGFEKVSLFFDELERVPDLIKQQGKKDLPGSAAKPDNARSGEFTSVSEATHALVQDLVLAAVQEIVSALDRINATLQHDRRPAAGGGQAPSGGGQ